MTREKTIQKLYIAAICVLIGAYLAAFCGINFPGFTRFCTGDMYEDTVVARLMWEQKTPFPANWVFGNQFYVVATPNLAALFYGLCGSMNLAMGLATTAMTLGMLASFWWMARPLVSRTTALAGTLALLCAVVGPYIVTTTEGQIFYLMASYYACYAITLFVTLGGYLRLCREGAKGAELARLAVLPALLNFATGMQSLRQTAVLNVPLLAYAALRLLWDARREGLSDAVRRALPSLTFALLTATANLAGLVAVKLAAPRQVTIYGGVSLLNPADLGEHLSTCFRALRSITGLKYLWEGGRAPALCAVLLTAAVLTSFFPGKEKSSGLRSLQFILILSLLAVLASSLVLDIALRNIYLFVWYPLAAASVMYLFETRRGKMRVLVAAALCCAAAINLACDYAPCLRDAFRGAPLEKQTVCQKLTHAGYTRLYGDWSICAEIAACSDGALTAGAWFGEPYRILAYINPTDIYTDADNARAAYLLLPHERDAALALAAEAGATLTPVLDEASYTIYVSDQQLMHE